MLLKNARALEWCILLCFFYSSSFAVVLCVLLLLHSCLQKIWHHKANEPKSAIWLFVHICILLMRHISSRWARCCCYESRAIVHFFVWNSFHCFSLCSSLTHSIIYSIFVFFFFFALSRSISTWMQLLFRYYWYIFLSFSFFFAHCDCGDVHYTVAHISPSCPVARTPVWENYNAIIMCWHFGRVYFLHFYHFRWLH